MPKGHDHGAILQAVVSIGIALGAVGGIVVYTRAMKNRKPGEGAAR